MKLPDSVWVGYKEVELVAVEHLITRGERCAEYRSGRDGTDPRIEYEEQLHGRELLATLLHEINHALVEMHIPAGTVTALPHEADKIEEVYVDALSIGLVCFLNDNKDFADWMWSILYDDA